MTGKPLKRRVSIGMPSAVLLVCGAILLAAALGAVAVDQLANTGQMVAGVSLGGADVGGLTRNAAAERVARLAETTVTVRIADAEPVTVRGSDLGLDVGSALNRAYLVGRVGALPQRLQARMAAYLRGTTVDLAAFDSGKASHLLAEAHQLMDRAPRDATFQVVGGKLVVADGGPGKKVDDQAFLAQLGAAATQENAGPREVVPPVVDQQPAVTAQAAAKHVTEAEKWTAHSLVVASAGRSATVSRDRLAGLLSVKGEKLVVSESKVAELLSTLGDTANAPVDARFDISGGVVRIVPGHPGSGADAAKTTEVLQRALASGAGQIRVAYSNKQPDVTAADLERLGIKRQLSACTTRFRLDQDRRDVNIALAAKSVRGAIVGIGETFSLNERTGPRDRSRGYQESLIIQNGKVVPGIGGGVCQVSSTLYQAALLAGQEIVDRQNHSMAVSYLPPGYDATTYYPIVDLKFRNDLGKPILLWSEVKGNTLVMSVWGGTRPQDIRIQTKLKKTLAPRTRIVYDSQLPHNERVVQVDGEPGSIVTAYRLTYRGGVLIRRELLSTDEYQPKDTVVRVGT